MESIVRRNIRDLDYVLILVMILISILSSVAIYTATYGKTGPDISSHIMIRQLFWEIISYAVMIFMTLYDYRSLAKHRWLLYGITLLLLVAVFGFHEINGARSWITFSSFSFQPSELAKVVAIIWTADYMARMNEREYADYSFKGLLPIFGIFLVPFVLILKEPALGQALIMLAILFTMLLVYVKRRHMQVMVAGFLISLVVIVLAAGPYANETVHLLRHQHVISSYQAERLISFVEPTAVSPDATYQVTEAEIAVGNGGLTGTGLLKGSQTSGGWVPFDWTDFIFSAIAEQLGFIGGSGLIMLFLIMLFRMIKVAVTSLDDFGSYLIAGFVGMFGFQVFQNIGMNLVITPATGITLPFVSYGGTSLAVNFLSIGIVLSVSLRRRTLRFD